MDRPTKGQAFTMLPNYVAVDLPASPVLLPRVTHLRHHHSDGFDPSVRYGRRELAPRQYTVSALLAHTLSQLAKRGTAALQFGPATGRWAYNSTISWWSLLPTPGWSERLCWEASSVEADYLPNKTP